MFDLKSWRRRIKIMMPSLMAANDALPVGTCGNLQIAVAPRDAVTAEVEVAMAGMFTHELGSDGLTGGLLHLDGAMGNAATRLRSDGIFRPAPGELLALSPTAPPIKASTILLVGMGDPDAWTPAALSVALNAAAADVQRRAVVSASFAPSLLDSGVHAGDPEAIAVQMLNGLLRGISVPEDAPPMLWLFCTGAAHLAATHAAFRSAFALHTAC
jgi:hypothetical protein